MQPGMTRITNLNDYPYEENFKGNKIYIAPKDSIEMESGEALLFKGTMGTPPRLKNGVPDPRFFKWLKFESSADVKKANMNKFKCQACGKVCKSQKGLNEHLKTHEDLEKGTMADGSTGDEDVNQS